MELFGGLPGETVRMVLKGLVPGEVVNGAMQCGAGRG